MTTDTSPAASCAISGCPAPARTYLPQPGSPVYETSVASQTKADPISLCTEHAEQYRPLRPL